MTLPASPDAEAALIARLLVDPRSFALVQGQLTPEMWYSAQYRDAWAAMQRIAARGGTIDLVSLRSEGVEITDPLHILTPGHHAPLEDYAATIRRKSFQRGVIRNLDDLTLRAYQLDDPADLVSAVQHAVQQIAEGIADDGTLRPVDQVVTDFWSSLGQPTRGVPYGIAPLDDEAGPMEPGNMVVVAARPSVGKTAFVEQTMDYLAAGDGSHPVLFCSKEMSSWQLTQRAVSRYAQIDNMRVRRGDLTPDERHRAERALDERRHLKLVYEDDPGATTQTLRAAAARLRLQHGGVKAIAVDYLQLLSDPGDNEYQRVTRISRMLKQIALENDCPLIALAQLSRASESREDKHPRLSDLRDSGQIEQDADVVLGLFAPNSWTRHIDVLKNRSGPAGGRVEVQFIAPQMRFVA